MDSTPNAEVVEQVLEAIAAAHSHPGTAAWVRSGLGTAGAKLRALRYILRTQAAARAARVLDVGTQTGVLPLMAAWAGCEASAVDLPAVVEVHGATLRAAGVDVRPCDLAVERLPFSDARFDFVAYLDVLEHHAFSPRGVLEELRRVLAPGGRLLVSTPNHASIPNRVRLALGQTVNDPFDVFFHSEVGRTYTGHHREYTKAELRSALVATGFEVLELVVVDEDPALLRRALRSPRTGAGERAGLLRGLALACAAALVPGAGRNLWAIARPEGRLRTGG